MSEAAIIAELLREERDARLEAELELDRARNELEQLRAELSANDDRDEWLTVIEAADEVRVSQATIYRAIKDGKLPGAKKIRGTLRIHRPTLLKSTLPKPGTPARRRPRKQRS